MVSVMLFHLLLDCFSVPVLDHHHHHHHHHHLKFHLKLLLQSNAYDDAYNFHYQIKLLSSAVKLYTWCKIKFLLLYACNNNKKNLKGIASILFLTNGLGKKCRKKTLKIILEVIIMRYVYSCRTLFCKYFRRYGLWKCKHVFRPPLWSNETDSDFCHQSPIYAVNSIFQPHVNFICTLDLEVFNFSEKIT
jgi:hypothetical protein